MGLKTVPWAHLRNEDRDGAYADYSAWETWLTESMPDAAAAGYEEADDAGAWKENLYAVMSEAIQAVLDGRVSAEMPEVT